MKKNGRSPEKPPVADLSTKAGRMLFRASIKGEIAKREREAEATRKALSETLREDRLEGRKPVK